LFVVVVFFVGGVREGIVGLQIMRGDVQVPDPGTIRQMGTRLTNPCFV
jgi:hypothetical protein